MAKYVDYSGVVYLWKQIVGAIQTAFSSAVTDVTYTTGELAKTIDGNDTTITTASQIVRDGISSVKGQASGVAPLDANSKVPVSNLPLPTGTTQLAGLDSNGLIPAENLPSYVDDVVEVDAFIAGVPMAPTTQAYGYVLYSSVTTKLYTCVEGETSGSKAWDVTDPEKSKIYVKLDTDETYRWSGTTMVEIANVGAAVQGLSSGTTQNHIVTWGADGYHVQDSGKTLDDVTNVVRLAGIVSSVQDITEQQYPFSVGSKFFDTTTKKIRTITETSTPTWNTGEDPLSDAIYIAPTYDRSDLKSTDMYYLVSGDLEYLVTYLPTTGTGTGVESIANAIAEAEDELTNS